MSTLLDSLASTFNGDASRRTVLEDALRDGLLYVVVHTGNFPEGELRGQFGAAVGGPGLFVQGRRRPA